MKNNKLIGTSLLAAITASLCCITPVLALIAGTSGIASAFSWVEPFRPYLIGLTILVLAFAWYQKIRPKTKAELECACEEDEKPSFWQSRKFLGFVTVFAAVMLAFPYYSFVFYPQNESNNTFAMSDNLKEITIEVKGMTCSSCEQHIEHAVGRLEGVESVKASYDAGTAVIRFLPSQVDDQSIESAINKTGYQVIPKRTVEARVKVSSDDITFYKVPLVCSAAPTIGCGSRAKPVLRDFEESPNAAEAWLNKAGTVIAVVWEKGTDSESIESTAERVYSKHQLQAIELSDDALTDTYSSFRDGENWLKGSEVDKLSKEEAAIIADNIMGTIKAKTALSAENEKKIHQKTTDVFYDFFLSYKSIAELGDANSYTSRLKEIWSFGENLLGAGRMPSLEELWKSCSSAAKSCNHESCSVDCKVPNS